MTGQEQLQERFKSARLRATRHRLAVAQILQETKAPISAREIYDQLAGTGASVGIATVYRVLERLETTGIVKRYPQMTGTSVHFAMAGSGEGQIVCSRCGKTEDIKNIPELAHLREKVSRQSEFATTEQSLYIIADCRNEKCD